MAKMGMAKNVVLTGLSFMCGVSQASARCTRFNLGCDMPALRASGYFTADVLMAQPVTSRLSEAWQHAAEARRAGMSQPRSERAQRAEAWEAPHINVSPVRTTFWSFCHNFLRTYPFCGGSYRRRNRRPCAVH